MPRESIDMAADASPPPTAAAVVAVDAPLFGVFSCHGDKPCVEEAEKRFAISLEEEDEDDNEKE